jgi:Pregnancy-associated plasma protein-A
MRRALTAVITAALVNVAATAAPANAALPSAVEGLSCAPGTSVSQTFAGWSENATARGPRESAARAIVGDSQIPAGQEPDTPASFRATIPVYFHVLAKSRKASDGWVSDVQIREQIEVLNAAFAGANTGFRFVLRGTTRTINARWHDMETLADELEAKQALKVGDAKTLNIYSTSISLGFAYYPKIVAGGYGGYHDLDGVVIHFGSMPGGYIRNYNLGHTATHEVGHYLGLPHTFDQGCQGHGDYVDDTPAMSVPTSGCPAGKDTCPEPGLDPVHNYMDYSYDTCYTEFTRGQATRMQQQYLHWRVKHGYSPATQ